MTKPAIRDIIIHAIAIGIQKPDHQSFAGVAELADARDLKSRDTKVSYRFDPGFRHQYRGVEQFGSSSGS